MRDVRQMRKLGLWFVRRCVYVLWGFVFVCGQYAIQYAWYLRCSILTAYYKRLLCARYALFTFDALLVCSESPPVLKYVLRRRRFVSFVQMLHYKVIFAQNDQLRRLRSLPSPRTHNNSKLATKLRSLKGEQTATTTQSRIKHHRKQ